MSDETVKYLLDESRIPTHWINLLGDLPGDPLPPLHPGTKEPAGPDDLTPIFPMALIMQEVSPRARDRDPRARPRRLQALAPHAAVPGPPARARRSIPRPTSTTSTRASRPPGRTSPTRRSPRPTRTHRPGIKRLSHRDRRRAVGLGAGVRLLAVRPRVRGVHGRLELRPEALPPLDDADLGRDRAPLAVGSDPGGQGQRRPSDGSLGIAISEAVEVAAQRDDTNYSLGSVLNHVCLHQTIIGQEAIAQMAMAGEQPDVIVGCVGGGSNFAGLDVPVHPRGAARQRQDAIPRHRADRLPDAHPRRLPLRLRRHRRADAADADVHARPRLRATAGACRRAALPRRRADALRAGQGRRRRGPGLHQNDIFAAAIRFARTEGIIPGPEPAHAIKGVIDEALAAREAGEERVILLGLSGHGHFDLGGLRRATWPASSRIRSSPRRTWTPRSRGCPRRPRSRSAPLRTVA